MRSRIATAALAALLALVPARAALAAPIPDPYGTNGFGRFFHIIPPGQNGTDNGLQAATFLATGERPPHSSDQRDLYTNLLYATPGLSDADLPHHFPDATFGVRDGEVETTVSPREDVTIVRDREFGLPHVYGSTRSGTMFGAGYASAQDRLFFMDIIRSSGAATLSALAGGANAEMDAAIWLDAPYTDADRARQVEALGRDFGPDGAQVLQDIRDYVAGVNAFIERARLDPTLMPAEYAAAGHPEGPRDWSVVDVLDAATLIGSQLGKGGGDELEQAERLQALMRRFGARRGYRVWRDLTEPDDPEAPVTAAARRGFPYGETPRRLGRTVALPDPGSLRSEDVVASGTGSGARAGRGGGARPTPGRGSGMARLAFPQAMSNALLVSAARSATGHPLLVGGSQTGYFTAEVWRYQDLHGPGIDVAGANIPGTGPYVEIGHGPDYTWTATSASQDIVDVYAVDLCEPDGSRPTLRSGHYRFRGRCLAMEAVERRIAWQPSLADSTPAGSQLLRALRTRLGTVIARATIGGRPVAYTRLRSTYDHELDSAISFLKWNSPARIGGVRDFQRAAFGLGYTFHWLYADDRDIGYVNTGANPVRRRGVNGRLPLVASRRTEWQGWSSETNTTTYQPLRERPQAVNQPYLVSWNNQAGRRCCGNGPYTPLYRSQLLTDALDDQLRVHRGKLSLANVVDAAMFGATADLRGHKLVPWLLRVLGRERDPRLVDAIGKLRAWAAAGAPRLDRDRDGRYEHTDAVRIMDAWMPLLARAVFEPRMGADVFRLYDRAFAADTPNTYREQRHSHLGSAFQEGWFGFAQKDLRAVLGRRVKGRWSIRFCGGGSLPRCRRAVRASLREALAVDPAKLYADPTVAGECGRMDAQACYDALRFRPVTAVTQPLIPWQNRPTQQQAAEVTSHRPR